MPTVAQQKIKRHRGAVIEPDEDERQQTWDAIREWEADGSFVLYWGNDLWVNGAGEVTSSQKPRDSISSAPR